MPLCISNTNSRTKVKTVVPKVLVVEDDDYARLSLNRLLIRLGHDVFLANNGQQGLALLEKNPVDIILTDIFMPDLDGFEFILEMNQKENAPPIIAMSGGFRNFPRMEILLTADLFGASKILPKPFSEEQLREAFAELLAGRNCH